MGIGQLVSTLGCYNCLQESIRALFDILPSVQPVSTQTMPWPCLTPCPSPQGSSPATVVPGCPQQHPCLVVFLPVFLFWACFCAARVHRNPCGSTNSCTNPHQCAGASRSLCVCGCVCVIQQVKCVDHTGDTVHCSALSITEQRFPRFRRSLGAVEQ